MNSLLKIIAIPVVLSIVQQGRFVAHAKIFSSPWHYECNGGLCRKTELKGHIENPLSLDACQIFCGHGGALWPKPTGNLYLDSSLAHLDPLKIFLHGFNSTTRTGHLLSQNVNILKNNVQKLDEKNNQSNGLALAIEIQGIKNSNDVKITLDTNENYTMEIYQADSEMIRVRIQAESYFGARHGLETLSQLIIYDDLHDEIQVVRSANISDGPVYPYRGILLDTSRHYIDKQTILRTIDAMSMSKLNTFHWHITDADSFPYVSRTWPDFSTYGAYTRRQVYTQEDIKEIIDFGILRGVRVLPEFDAPAHVGEGWQWVGHNAIVCFAAEPWGRYCASPPCGQLNPTSDRVYEILEGIYRDMIEDFSPDIFHMGGDEVNINCWKSSESIKNWMSRKGWYFSESSFIRLWDLFQQRAYEKLKLANGGIDIPVILWTSTLTNQNYIHHLDPNRYIIQIWTDENDATIKRLVENNFKMIFSNYDTLYLDCGFGSWVGEGNNWCSPYKGWQKIYENSPLKIIKKQGFDESKKHLILGGEAALWTEQVDSTSVDSRLWPRSAALAERLWGEPSSSWRDAEHRMLKHRERLVNRAIFADSLEPEWCLQNQGKCHS